MNIVAMRSVFALCLAAAPAAAAKPLKVFILAGQSNMQGHARISTFDSLADDPQTAPLLREMRGPDGKPRVCKNVWISSIGCLGDAYTDLREKHGNLTAGFGAPEDKIGPEFTFGLHVEKTLNEPALIIKTSWGGRSLHTDFRPPSAGPYAWSEHELAQSKRRGDDPEKFRAKKLAETGVYYRCMIDHVKKTLADCKRVVPNHDPEQGFELAGFVWFQGFNDLVADSTYDQRMKPGGYALYGDLLAHFISDVRKDLAAPKLPFVIGVMGIGGIKEGAKPPQLHFRQAQLAPTFLPEFKGNVLAVQTAPFWDEDLEFLEQRRGKLNAALDRAAKKAPKAPAAERNAARQQALAENFTPAELKRLQGGVSNGGYHYLGAAKIMAPIGKAFAEALVGPAPKVGADSGAKPVAAIVRAGPANPGFPHAALRPDGQPGAAGKPVKVFILMGQSNMVGMGDLGPESAKGTLERVAKTEKKYPWLVGADGQWTARQDVYYYDARNKKGAALGPTANNGKALGPELGFGYVLGSVLDAPVLVLKSCTGNRSLGWDLLPPGSPSVVADGKTYAGYRETPESWVDGQPKKEVKWYAGKQYDDDQSNAKTALQNIAQWYPGYQNQGFEIAGFVWWQGHKDTGNAVFAGRYEENLARLIQCLRKDYNAPQAKFVLATGCGNPGRTGLGLKIAEAQLAVADARKHPSFKGNVKAVDSRDLWRDAADSPKNQGHHYNRNAETYLEVGLRLGWAMAELLKE